MAQSEADPVSALSPAGKDPVPCVLLELFEPEDGQTNLRNWMLAHGAVARATECVILYISPASATLSFSAYRSMMKTGYTVLWDAARVAGKLDLIFSVVGDVPSHGLEASTACTAVGRPIDAILVTRPDGLLSRRRLFDETLRQHLRQASVAWEDARRLAEPVPPGTCVVDFDGADLPQCGRVVLGGTFDRLHSGHRMLLTYAAAAAAVEVVVGVCSDEMLQSKADKARIQPLEERVAAVEAFLRGIKPGLGVRVVAISDPFGPSIVERDIDAIAVSSETLAGAIAVNRKRAERDLPPLKFLVTNRFEAHSLSSSFIRAHV